MRDAESCCDCLYVRRYDQHSSRSSCFVSQAKQGWAHALQRKSGGMRFVALVALVILWLRVDTSTNVEVYKDVWGFGWTGYVLLMLLLSQ